LLITESANLIKNSKHAVVLSGAGISTPSGIPDFRSTSGGLWEEFDPMEVASLSVFRITPSKFFNWFRPMAKTIYEAAPNPAHLALAELEKRGYIQEIITQNIDVLHQKAGSKNVHEVHGTTLGMTCTSCYEKFESERFLINYIETGEIPLCSSCKQTLKPDVILFEEQLPVKIWNRAAKAIKNCDLLIVVGSSLEVKPVSNLPYSALAHGAKMIIINQSPTYIDSRADIIIREDLADVLPSIAQGILN